MHRSWICPWMKKDQSLTVHSVGHSQGSCNYQSNTSHFKCNVWSCETLKIWFRSSWGRQQLCSVGLRNKVQKCQSSNCGQLTLNSRRSFSPSKSSKGIRRLSSSSSICLTQLASAGRWAESGSKWRTSVDTQHGGEGKVWHVLWWLLQTLIAVCVGTLPCSHTVCGSSHLSTSTERLIQPFLLSPLTFFLFTDFGFFFFNFPAKTLPPPRELSEVLWDSDKIRDATGAANQKFEILWKLLASWVNQWGAREGSM